MGRKVGNEGWKGEKLDGKGRTVKGREGKKRNEKWKGKENKEKEKDR